MLYPPCLRVRYGPWLGLNDDQDIFYHFLCPQWCQYFGSTHCSHLISPLPYFEKSAPCGLNTLWKSRRPTLVPSWTLLNLTQDICPLRITQNISKYLKIALYVIYKTQKRFGFGWMLVFHGLSLQIVGPAYLVFLVFIPCC